jgi:hypothetical protein
MYKLILPYEPSKLIIFYLISFVIDNEQFRILLKLEQTLKFINFTKDL